VFHGLDPVTVAAIEQLRSTLLVLPGPARRRRPRGWPVLTPAHNGQHR
jgi:hypothetical protein